MGYLSKYGTLWGVAPHTRGQMFFVAPAASYVVDGRTYSASDNNDGLSPERALLTVAQAITNAQSNGGDSILLMPGDHSVSAAIAVNKTVNIMGIPGGQSGSYSGNVNYMRPRTTITQSTASTNIFTVTAADVEISNLKLISFTTSNAVGFSAAANRLFIHDCQIDTSVAATSTSVKGLVATGGATHVVIGHCSFTSTGAQGPWIDLTGCIDSVVESCSFVQRAGALAVGVQFGAATAGCMVRDSDMWAYGASGAITVGFDLTGVTDVPGVNFHRNYFNSLVTGPIKNASGNTIACITNNYKGTNGAGTGGGLVTVII